MPEKTLPIPLDELVVLAVEHWRLAGALREGASAPARHALRKIADFLQACGVEAHSLDGLPYDAGLNAKVVDRIPARSAGEPEVVAETISPLVTFQGAVVRAAEVVIAGG